MRKINTNTNIVVKPGQVYECTANLETRNGDCFDVGSRFTVFESTGQAPHNEIMSKGFNWVIISDKGASVWATFESCIERGLFKLVEDLQ